MSGTPVCNTPAKVADIIEGLVPANAYDVFVILVPTAPAEFELFCSTVVP